MPADRARDPAPQEGDSPRARDALPDASEERGFEQWKAMARTRRTTATMLSTLRASCKAERGPELHARMLSPRLRFAQRTLRELQIAPT